MVKITVLTVAVLSGGLAVACGGQAPGVATPHASTTPSIVAWVDHPAAQVPIVLRSPPYSTGARPCRPADLSVSHGELGYAAGNTSVEVYLTNRSATACWLDGYPAIAGVAANGTVTPLHARHGSFPGSPGPSANIKPGQTAAINISGGDNCAPALDGEHQVYPELLIGLPGGGTVGAYGTGFDAICGVSASPFGVPADQTQGPAPSPLTARGSSPAPASALTASTRHPIRHPRQTRQTLNFAALSRVAGCGAPLRLEGPTRTMRGVPARCL